MTGRKYAGLIAYLVLVVTVVALIWYANRAESAQPQRYEVYVVQAGQTLWDIARERYPGAHTGEMVHRIREINGTGGKLRSAVIRPGDELLVPVK